VALGARPLKHETRAAWGEASKDTCDGGPLLSRAGARV